MAGQMTTVVITWLDGTQDTYTCDGWHSVRGVLYLTQRMHSSEPSRAFPLTSIRMWTY